MKHSVEERAYRLWRRRENRNWPPGRKLVAGDGLRNEFAIDLAEASVALHDGLAPLADAANNAVKWLAKVLNRA